MRLHKPVLLHEAVECLNCQRGGRYVDCTLGMGGHAERILELSSPDGHLLAIDRDEEAIRFAEKRLASYGRRVEIVHGDFRMLNTILENSHFPFPSGILADLGPSLLQFTTPERGFSFQLSGPLDMRMDKRQKETAEHIVNTWGLGELSRVLREFGEERAATSIARRIIEERKRSPIHTTDHLAQIVKEVAPGKHEQKIHPATRTFQALRIAVNRELEELDTFVFDAFDSLANGGRLVVIAFHSLEDRIIKQTFRFLSAACRCPKRILQCQCGGKPLSKLLVKKPVTPGAIEIEDNPASRSARLRALEKLTGSSPRDLWAEWRHRED